MIVLILAVESLVRFSTLLSISNFYKKKYFLLTLSCGRFSIDLLSVLFWSLCQSICSFQMVGCRVTELSANYRLKSFFFVLQTMQRSSSQRIRNGFWRTLLCQCFHLCPSLEIVTKTARKFCKYFFLFTRARVNETKLQSKFHFRIVGIVLWSIKICRSLHGNYTFYKMCHHIIFTAASISLIVVHFSTGLNIVCQIVSWTCLSK